MSGPGHGPRAGAHDEHHAIPVVGVGASAGGLEALGLLLAGMPPDTGMAFVLIQHLAPGHESLLPEILRKRTTLPIDEARDGDRLEANHVYVVAAGTEILLIDGRLSVIPRDSNATVDLFLSTLARVRKEHAIGVVLSGTGSDGTAGALAIHHQGGLMFAQDPRTCSHDGMPASAIASGAVDMILPPEDIGRELARIARHAFVRLPAAADGESLRPPLDRPGLDQVLAALETTTGVRFADYKPNTILRRTMRRMAIHSIDSMARYADLIRERPEEGQALFADVLIHVTGFFRDPEVFDILKQGAFPAMLEQQHADEAIKIWVPGCASGEEAFSIAIAFSEFLESVRSRISYQVFATDLDGAQITRARVAQYPATIATDVSAERLSRYFVRIPGGYRVAPEIRERCVFARHNLLGDPPFSRTDLVSCRNVMIYFNSVAQRRLIPTFHYALNPGGFLMLGASEGIGSFGHLFSTLDDKHKIFRRLDVHGSSGSLAAGRTRDPLVQAIVTPSGAVVSRGPTTVQRRTDEFLANKYAPPAVVIQGDLSIIQFRGDTSPYLTPAPGAASLNILRMARPGLETGLRAAILEAKKKQQSVRKEGLWIQEGEHSRQVCVEVEPVPASGLDAGYLVVLFEAVAPATGDAVGGASRPDAAKGAAPRPGQRAFSIRRIDELERELAATRSQFQGIVTDRDEANEMLQVVNEEAVSANEELQSINEELATAKEELQSTNEELTTLNDELRTRNVDLVRLGDELTHLLAGVGAPVVVVDAGLIVHRVSAGAEDVFGGRPPRIGSTLLESVAPFDFTRIESELKRLLGLGIPSTIPIPRRDARRFLIRVQPYRRADGVIDGAVLVIVDVEDLERNVAERTSALQASNDQMVMFSHSVSHDLRAPIRAMHGYAEALLDEDGPELGAVRRRYGMQIIDAAARLDALVLGLLTFSRIRNIELVMEPLQLHALVLGCVSSMHMELEVSEAQVEVDMPPSLPDVGAHAVTLSQVIVNVIANAMKFVPPDTRPRVRIRAEERGDVVRLWVEDNGIGIRPSHQERIFKVFERLHPNEAYSGVGIGLAFAKQALVRMGGEIGVESVEGEGSRFWIDLPTEFSRKRAGKPAAIKPSPETVSP
jgi:two-component system, chemotaxis family, CheB/CheR fusion protein